MPTRFDPHRSDSALEMLCAADYPAEEVNWLWPGRIPIGKVTLLVGDPGTGKSLVALDIAARVSSGAAWPDEPLTNEFPGLEQPYMWGSVLILSAEDDLRDTIRPRLDAAGANPNHVYVLPSVADLRNDLDKLRAAVDEVSNCSLVIIDPINAFMGPGDSHFHTVVRRVFEPLAKLAAEKGIAVLCVSHLRKHDGAAIQRAAGSMGFVAAARAVWTVCRDPVQADRYLMLQVKNNFVAESAGLAYKISAKHSLALAKGRGESNSAPSLTWHADPVATSAVEALKPEKKSRGPEPAELSLAIDYVQSELLTGPKSAEYILAGAEGGGFSDSTVRRALVAIGGKTRKERPYGFGSWLWYLPDHDFEDIKAATSENVESASPLQRAVVPVPDKPEDDPSENLMPSQKNEGSKTETCSLREKTIEPPCLFEDSVPANELVIVPPADSSLPLRKPTPEQAWAKMFKESNEGHNVSYEYYMAQCKLRRYLWVSSRRPKVLLKRVKIDLLKPHTFRRPPHCRAP